MSGHFDVIVVGVGAMGSSTCYELARRGARVLGIDRFSIPNNLGSSHGQSRVIRMAYYEHPDYVPLLVRAFERWEHLQDHVAEEIWKLTGGLYLGRPDGEFISRTLRSIRAHHQPHEQLQRDEVMRRFPQFAVADDHVGIWEPNAGYVRPERAVAAYAELALHRGARVHGHEQVVDWRADPHGVEVTTDRDTYHAGTLIFCSGAWTHRLLADLDLDLVVSRQILAWVWPKQPELFAGGRMPIWGIDDPEGHFYYGFPMMSGPPGFKLARHYQGPPTDADLIDRTVHRDDEKDIRRALRQYLPAADGPLLSLAACMYTNTPDEHFILDRHPEHERVLVAGGFSGHGFKFASVVGEVMADLALEGETSLPVSFLGLSRLLSGK